MASPRITHANPTESGRAAAPVLERLEYRIAQSDKKLGADSTRDSMDASAPMHTGVAFFPDHADDLFGERKIAEASTPTQEPETGVDRAVAELERRLAEEKASALQAIAAALEQGRMEERQSSEKSFAVEQQQCKSRILHCLEEFRIERQMYFDRVEGEVVRLSLAIAARVLHRETHLDPMLLAGAVRVALDKLADSSSVVMRVPPVEVSKWREFFRAAGNARIQPGVLEDPSLSAGECLLGTELGTVELGVRAQLEEIEKGFFDLLNRRPSGSSPVPASGVTNPK